MVYAQQLEQLDSLFGRLTEAGLEPLGVDVVDDGRDPVRELLRIRKLGAAEVIAAVDGLVARLVDELGVAAGDHPAVVAVDVLVCPAAGGPGRQRQSCWWGSGSGQRDAQPALARPVLTMRSAVVVKIVALTEQPKWFQVCEQQHQRLPQETAPHHHPPPPHTHQVREVRALTLKPIIGFLATPLVAPADPSSASVAASRIIVAASSYYWH